MASERNEYEAMSTPMIVLAGFAWGFFIQASAQIISILGILSHKWAIIWSIVITLSPSLAMVWLGLFGIDVFKKIRRGSPRS